MNEYQQQLMIWYAAYLKEDREAYDEANQKLMKTEKENNIYGNVQTD